MQVGSPGCFTEELVFGETVTLKEVVEAVLKVGTAARLFFP
jgi:hypothetical protein